MKLGHEAVVGAPISAPEGHTVVLLRGPDGLRATVRDRQHKITSFAALEEVVVLFTLGSWSDVEVGRFLKGLTPARTYPGLIAAAVESWQTGKVISACKMISALTNTSTVYGSDRYKIVGARLDAVLDWLPTPDTAPIAAAAAYEMYGYHPIILHHVADWSEDGAPICSCPRGLLCKAAGKHPRMQGWKTHKPLPLEIEEWWSRIPNANVGLAMGGAKRLVALDVDGEKGHESLESLEAQNEPLVETLTQRTGREGGEQRLFRVADDQDLSMIRSTTSQLGAGLDVRANGALIVVSPSLHKSKRRYQWKNAAPLADLPEWLYKLMSAPLIRAGRAGGLLIASGERPQEQALPKSLPERIALATAHISKMPPGIEGQNGSLMTLRAAIAAVRGFCLPPNMALSVLSRTFNPRCRPPWTEWELGHKIEAAEMDVSVPWGYLMGRGKVSDAEADSIISAMLSG
jgi:hypothetical protein